MQKLDLIGKTNTNDISVLSEIPKIKVHVINNKN